MESQNPIDKLKEQHEFIERELIELETIAGASDVNFSNLAHVWKRLLLLWEEHENLEESIFPIMEKEKIKIPVKKMLFEHKELRVHKEAIRKALETGNNLKFVLENNVKTVIRKLREHIESEDQILYTIALEEFSEKEIIELSKIAKK